ncbi:CapA family protein [Clostridium sp.]|uniref:CapA family protein n=1 Tax=Clostridium sp. TaxID=1506 RepID=UPI001A49B4AC|nr:CapA family protein [Clostridium sp.]MBK5240895.1 CapA family protein [Clostridium sp.]
MKKSIKILAVICIFIATIISTIIINIQDDNYSSNKNVGVKIQEGKNITQDSEKIEVTKAIKDVKDTSSIEVSIVAVGDVIVHDEQLKAQYDKSIGKYSFYNNFKYVKSHIESADIALANLETTLAGEEKKYTGYPLFNSPSSLVDAMKDCGFDILSTANNHTIDRGSEGVFSTLAEIQKRNLKAVGTRENLSEKPYIIQDVKGIKIGVISYSYETPRNGNDKTLNAIKIPSKVTNLINTFSYEYIEEDLNKIKVQIDEMKGQGAEAIIFVIHWGNEYERKPNVHQISIANKLCDFGVDVILGSHPHVIQPIEFITSEKTGKRSLVVYSMGNFISNQRYEYTDNRYTEDGIIVNIDIEKSVSSNEIIISAVSYIPTWVNKYSDNSKLVFEILPLGDALASKGKYDLNDDIEVWRASNSSKNTQILIGENSEILEQKVQEVMN